MEFRIADTFTDSLARLTGEAQKAVKTTAFDLQLNPANPGMSFHRLAKAKDKRFWSVRVGSDLRLIVHQTSDSLLLCYVDHHDGPAPRPSGRRRRRGPHPAGSAPGPPSDRRASPSASRASGWTGYGRVRSLGQFAPHHLLVETTRRQLTDDQRYVLLGEILWPVSRYGDLEASTNKMTVSGLLGGQLHETVPKEPTLQPPPCHLMRHIWTPRCEALSCSPRRTPRMPMLSDDDSAFGAPARREARRGQRATRDCRALKAPRRWSAPPRGRGRAARGRTRPLREPGESPPRAPAPRRPRAPPVGA